MTLAERKRALSCAAMPTRTVLLAIVLCLPLGLVAAADPIRPGVEILEPVSDPAADRTAAKIDLLSKRLTTNLERLETQQARHDEVTNAVTTAEKGLAKLAAQHQTIEELAAKVGKQLASSRGKRVSEATILALNEANAAVVPLQRSKRDWTRTVTEGKRQLVDLDRQIASLTAERGRLERELTKASAAP